MTDAHPTSAPPDDAAGRIAVGAWVRAYPGTDREQLGTVVEDFGDVAGHRVQIGQLPIADAARRWAVQLDDGTLVFVDTADIAAS